MTDRPRGDRISNIAQGAEAELGSGRGEAPLVVFTVAGVSLAVPAESVDSVSGVEEPAPVPGSPPHLLGLVATGERVQPLVDLGAFLQLAEESVSEVDPLFRRTLFVRSGELEAGLVCHRARGLTAVPVDELTEPEVLQGAGLRPFLTAEIETSSGVIGVLDLDALLEAAAIS